MKKRHKEKALGIRDRDSESLFESGGVKGIIVYPCGDVGIKVCNLLNNIYGIEPAYIIDNHKSKYSSKISNTSILRKIDINDYVLILASTNFGIYDELKANISCFPIENIYELECMKNRSNFPEWKTTIGKYSYGPICYNHPFIKSIGAFCSFATGVDYVANHETRYLSTHPIVFESKLIEGYEFSFKEYVDKDYYMEGIEPISELIKKQGRATVGNDVWLGRNVIVVNSSNIGNGVIAGAGAVITKDVPDYAIVAGVPAKILRYRYTNKQIRALNKIAWWNWSDERIRECFSDFYLPVEEFIDKYKNENV